MLHLNPYDWHFSWNWKKRRCFEDSLQVFSVRHVYSNHICPKRIIQNVFLRLKTRDAWLWGEEWCNTSQNVIFKKLNLRDNFIVTTSVQIGQKATARTHKKHMMQGSKIGKKVIRFKVYFLKSQYSQKKLRFNTIDAKTYWFARRNQKWHASLNINVGNVDLSSHNTSFRDIIRLCFSSRLTSKVMHYF